MSSGRHLTWKELSMEFVAGVFFFIALIVLGIFTMVLSRETFFMPKITREVVFADVSGLSEGDDVQVHGVNVGRVERLELTNGAVHVFVRLKETLKLYRNYRIEVRYSSVLGGRHVAIAAGSPDSGDVSSTEVLNGVAAGDLVNEATRLVQEARAELQNIRDKLEKEQVIEKISRFTDDMTAVSADLRAGKGTLGKLLVDPSLYDRANETLTSIRNAGDNINVMVADVRGGKGTLGKLMTEDSLYVEAKGIMTDIRGGRGTLGKLFTDDEVYNQLRGFTTDMKQVSERLVKGESTLGRLLMDKGELYLSLRNTLSSAEEVAEAIRSGKGTLGKLAMDPTLYDDTKKTILEVRGAIQDMREQAPVSTFGSLILGSF